MFQRFSLRTARLAVIWATLLIACSCGAPMARIEDAPSTSWMTGTPAHIAETTPERWALLSEANTLESRLTGLLCPALAGSLRLAAANSQFGGECQYQAIDTGGIIATSMSVAPREAMARLAPTYEALAADPALQFEGTDRSAIGACTVEARRIWNASAGFHITMHDLYAPDALLQFRVAARDTPGRQAVETAGEQLVRLNIHRKCQTGN